MELASLASDVQLSNVGQTTGFTMEANEFSFRVLSDGLYQNKIGSMVREVSCNGLDSHVQAGTPDLPVRLHLPDTYEPYFSVQDFGIGLNDAGVRQTFATYFRSTKRNDNAAIGAFGLGSKTPFAYTDAFTIVAVKDGQKRQYSAFIGEKGLPSIANMGGEFSASYILTDDNGNNPVAILDEWNETDEANGVTIIVPVTSSADFRRFRTEVQNQLAFFPVKPEILNCDTIEWMDWTQDTDYLNLDNVLIGEYNHRNSFNGLWIVQGPVGYKADVDLIKQSMSHDNREFLDIIGECGILRFELGQIEVTPSREGLSYSKKTIAAIEALLDTARASVKDKIQAQVDALGDAWATATGINSNNMLRRMAAITKAKFEADGYYKSAQYYYVDLEKMANIEGLEPAEDVVTGDVALGFDATWDESEPSDDDDTEEEDEDEGEEGKRLADLLNLQFRQYTHERVSRRGRVRKWRESGVGRHAKADHTFTVLIRDTAHKPVVRIRTFMGALPSSNLQVYVLQNRHGGPLTADEITAIRERFGASWEPALMSEVELPERETSGYRSGYKAPTAYTFGRGDNNNDTTDWERETEKLKEFDGAYYVTVFRNQTNATGQDSVVFQMANAGLLDKPIMAIREKDAAKLAGNPDWIPVSVKAAEVIESVKGNKELVNARKLKGARTSDIDCMDSAVTELLRKACEAGTIAKSSPLYRLFRMSKSLEKAKSRASNRGYNSIVETAMQYAGLVNDTDALNTALKARAAKLTAPVIAAYPLLPFMSSGRHSRWECPTTKAEHIIAYVNANTGE
jgi:hypothetical protein